MDILPNKQVNILEKTAIPQQGEGLKLPGIPRFPKMSGHIYSDSKLPLVLSLIILFAVVFIWLGLFFYNRSLDKEQEILFQKMEQLKKEENKEMVNKIISMEKGLKSAKGLLAAHTYPSNIFGFLERLTFANVAWEKFDFDAEGLESSLSGRAQTYNVIAKQILVFQSEPAIANISVSGVQLDQNGGVSFSAKIIFNSKILVK